MDLRFVGICGSIDVSLRPSILPGSQPTSKHPRIRRMSLFDLSGKVAVITGSSRGIGRAIAERMAEHGARVVISSRKQQACDEVAKAINDKAGKAVALAIAANISTKDDLKHLIEETNRTFGKID